jgi:hypothetical protein
MFDSCIEKQGETWPDAFMPRGGKFYYAVLKVLVFFLGAKSVQIHK